MNSCVKFTLRNAVTSYTRFLMMIQQELLNAEDNIPRGFMKDPPSTVVCSNFGERYRHRSGWGQAFRRRHGPESSPFYAPSQEPQGLAPCSPTIMLSTALGLNGFTGEDRKRCFSASAGGQAAC